MSLYQRIKEQIRGDFVCAAQRNSGARLPSERELQARYAASRPTISKALAELEAEGVVTRSHRRGTFVVPQVHGGSQAGSPARRIGFVAPFTGSPLSQRLLRGIDRVARPRGYQVLMACNGTGLLEQEQAGAMELIDAGVCGLVINPAPRRPGEDVSDYLMAADLGVPVVLVDMGLPEHPHAQIVFDNESVTHQLTSWLANRGRRRIAILTQPHGWMHPTLISRHAGYVRALRELGIPYDPDLVRPYFEETDISAVGTHVGGWMDLPDPPTAIIASEDRTAMEVIDQLTCRGLCVPEDVTVVGFDNLEETARFPVPFPTTNPCFHRMGEMACSLLLDAAECGRLLRRTYVLEAPMLLHRKREAAPGLAGADLAIAS